MKNYSPVEIAINKVMKFLEWYELKDPIGYTKNLRVFVSPDRHKLDIVWLYPDGSWQSEQADYDKGDEYDSIEDWLEEEVEGDAWESHFVDEEGYQDISEVDGLSIDSVSKISLDELETALGFAVATIENWKQKRENDHKTRSI